MKVTCDGHFSHLAKPNGRNVLKWVSNLVFKLHNDPTINESNILVLLGQIWIYAKKKKKVLRDKGKKNLRGRDCKNVCKYKNWPKMSIYN